MTNGSAVDLILAAMPEELPRTHRFVIALAGPPAAGKSTLAAALCGALEPRAAVLGLDGFHYDNTILSARGDLARKGATHTFDVDGYERTLAALRNNPDRSIAVPVFERDLDLSRNAAEIVSDRHHILITEGNYLLLRDEPWVSLAHHFDMTVSVTTDIDVIKSRIRERWQAHGLTDADAVERFAANDEPNARLVLATSRPAAISIQT